MFDFSNAELIKEKVREAKLKAPPAYNVHDCYHETGVFQRIARNIAFEYLTLGVIVVNAFWISVDTDGNTAPTLLTAKLPFVIMDVLFFSYFSAELFIRFMAFKRKVSCLRDAWFVFDTSLVVLYAFDPFVIAIVAKAQNGRGLNLPTSVIRLLRLARLSRLVRMLRALPELMIMIKGMVTATASVVYTLGLLLVVTYVFAIALVNLVPEASDEFETNIAEAYFSSVPESIHSLIIYGTFLDNLSDFILNVKAQSVPCFLLTWLYICLASLTVMNMLIGVLCEVISSVATEERESMTVEKVSEKFGKIVEELDNDSDGTLSWEEFQKILTHPEGLKALDSLQVNAEIMVDMAEDYFFEDGEPVAMSFSEFMEMVLDSRSAQQATLKDIIGLGRRFNQKLLTVTKRIDRLGTKMSSIDQKLDRLAPADVKLCS